MDLLLEIKLGKVFACVATLGVGVYVNEIQKKEKKTETLFC